MKQEEGTFPKSFYGSRIIMDPQTRQKHNIPHEHLCKIPNKTLVNRIQHYMNTIYNQVEFTPRMQDWCNIQKPIYKQKKV